MNGNAIKNQSCIAVDYVMIARAAGDQSATVSQFWSSTGATRSGFSNIPNHTVTFSYNGPLEDGSEKQVNQAVPRLNAIGTNGQLAVFQALQTGPVLIGGSIKSSSGPEAHWMLGVGTATDSKGSAAIVANDPWSGTQVKIDPTTGKVVDVMNTATGTYQPLQSAVRFNPLYEALTTFNYTAGAAGFVGVTIH